MGRAKSNVLENKATQPQVRRLISAMLKQGMSGNEMGERSGISKTSLYNWASGTRFPTIANLEACWNVLGYTLQPVPLIAVVPTHEELPHEDVVKRRNRRRRELIASGFHRKPIPGTSQSGVQRAPNGRFNPRNRDGGSTPHGDSLHREPAAEPGSRQQAADRVGADE